LEPIDTASVLKYKQDGVLDKNRAMDNVQKHNSCINVPSSQTFRSYGTTVLKYQLTALNTPVKDKDVYPNEFNGDPGLPSRKLQQLTASVLPHCKLNT
jgi:hypothetical protein